MCAHFQNTFPRGPLRARGQRQEGNHVFGWRGGSVGAASNARQYNNKQKSS